MCFVHGGSDYFRVGDLENHCVENFKFHFISFHFIFNSLDMVAPQIQGSGLQGTMLKTSI